ncbi:hypothetical protein ONE63_004016 [Megalurothrips usitatus]|uniref:CREG-like beta-barrel domain-containing protein n=1 Tax=Megalurothrips usitatus TaxID=439358 RepID=A0AAV7X8G9_9NEOP|nr:hypothetical protein ONE63_004016 [Megalurothrips usitatus]
MRAAVVALVLLALVISNSPTDARRKGEENWKQRYRKWKDSEEQDHLNGGLIGTDEAAAAKLHREEQNSVYDAPSEDELWRQKIEEKKKRQRGEVEHKQKPTSEITAWHEEKWRRQQEQAVQTSPYFQRQKRRQPRDYHPEHHNGRNVRMSIPDHTKVAEMARYIVHNSNWTAVAYTSRQPGTYGLPMADIFSISDGLKDNSTGIPYMYISPKDTGVQDLAKDGRCSMIMSLSQSDYCRQEGLDPEDPRCGHVILTGKLKTVKNGTEEAARAEKLFFDRHPQLRNMPKDHKFRFAKLKISQILVQDYFGGPAQPTLAEYFAAKPEVSSGPKDPIPEAQAELLPGASSDSQKWLRPME